MRNKLFISQIQFMTEHDSGKVDYYLRESHEKQPCDGVVINGSSEFPLHEDKNNVRIDRPIYYQNFGSLVI